VLGVFVATFAYSTAGLFASLGVQAKAAILHTIEGYL
jgi:hypothetical protein